MDQQAQCTIIVAMRLFLTGFLLTFFTLPVWGQSGAQGSIRIEAQYDGKYLAQLPVEVLCSAGSVQENLFTLGPGEGLVVHPEVFETGKTFCQVRSSPLGGYSVTYSASGPGKSSADRNGCHFSPLAPGNENRCTISVVQDAVTLTVYKKWIGGSGKDNPVRVSLECESGRYSGMRMINEGAPDSWEIRDIDPEGILCNVSEEVRETFSPDIIDCQGLLLLPGKGEECTMINTKIVKRIEMFNRYGKIIMIILVLGVGLVAAKRFS